MTTFAPLLLVVSLAQVSTSGQPPASAYVGTYTTGKDGRGIYFLAGRERPGPSLAVKAALNEEEARSVANPSFLAVLRRDGSRFVYAVEEVGSFQGQPTGAVVAYRADEDTGMLRRLNAQSSGGSGPCHIIVDRQGANVLVANYGDGSVAVLPIAEDGSLKPPSCVIQHRGSSVDKRRQEGPHAHAVVLDAANRFAVVADLGLDKLMIYQYDAEKGTLQANDPPFATVEPGAGPRHFAFHPDGRYAYVNNEMASTVTAFRYDPDRGAFETIETLSTLPDGYDRSRNTTAEIAVHPSGRFLYVSNRGHDSIVLFAIEPESGRLKPIGHTPTGGRTPRNFAIDPTGTRLLAANQDSDSIVEFAIDPDTGKLEPTGASCRVPKPVCIAY
jgi:6-phosphogluconolactonase